MSIFSKVLRAGEGRKAKALASLVPDINALEPETRALSDADLAARTVSFRERIDRAGPDQMDDALNDLLVEAFAVVREAARRVIGQRHYDVQLMGGAALHFGWIAEMRTGEGKTLVSTLPVYLNGLSGRGVHVVTVNDYLARRDALWMGKVHAFLGLQVGIVLPQMVDPAQKRAAYSADITYGTNNEFGFDYLRDNMAMAREDMVQRGHNFAIVDEVDSILVDEARTPLIISGQVRDAAALYYKFAAIVGDLDRDVDYEVDEEKRTVVPTEEGIDKVERLLGVDNLYDEVSTDLVHQLQSALRAKELYKPDVDYVVADDQVKIVDEFTGRILEGRRWSEGLHQAVEAKERVPIKQENQTLATITLQNYFRMYSKLAGMTGTAETEASEFAHTYNLPVVKIPTHRAMVRADQADLIYKSEEAKFDAVVADIAERSEIGQPVLVGTVSVEKSERLSRLLDKRGVRHTVLNAKQHEREAIIVAQAGRLGAVTVATNMAGRGVDIILGGNAEALARLDAAAEGLSPDSEEGRAKVADRLKIHEPECLAEGEKIRELGGLYVLGTERHESRRIDNQLRGRAGRQGDPGESRFYLSLGDDLMRLFATGAMSWVMGKALPDEIPIEAKMVTRAIEKAQGTVEARNAEIRKNVLKYDEVMNEQRKVIYRRRQAILQGADLRAEAVAHLDAVLERMVRTFCLNEYSEEWDLEGLLVEAKAYYPTEFTLADLEQATSLSLLTESLQADARSYYGARETNLTPEVMRILERQVMLTIIDTRWRQHLSEMDYLEEGIGLRAMGQRDPLTEWRREGFEMFSSMIDSIADDFVRYMMRMEVMIERARQPEIENVAYTAPEDPSDPAPALPGPVAAMTAGSMTAGSDAEAEFEAEGPAPVSAPSPGGPASARPAVATRPAPAAKRTPVVTPEHQKLGRNQLCWCGSQKKYKVCHGTGA
ncbi:MAG: preprotein translocase subunit SecA [Acidimicrobiales bacterium]